MDDLDLIIKDAHMGLDFGTVTLNLNKSNGKIVSVQAQKMATHKVTNNTEALAMVMQMIKAMQAGKLNGHLTYTIRFNAGEANRVTVQDTRSHATSKFS